MNVSDEVTRELAVSFTPEGEKTLQAQLAALLPDTPIDIYQTIKASLLGNREQMRAVLRLASEGKLRTVVERFPMEQADAALNQLARGELRSRAVLVAPEG